MRNLHKLKTYLFKLIEYLHSFLEKVRPLVNMEVVVSQFRLDFEVAYEKGGIVGW